MLGQCIKGTRWTAPPGPVCTHLYKHAHTSTHIRWSFSSVEISMQIDEYLPTEPILLLRPDARELTH